MKNTPLLYTLLITAFISIASQAFGQRIDSVLATGGLTGDTIYIITENRLLKNKFLGNSWYAGLSYNLSRSNEFSINIGRTYGKSFCGGAGCYLTMRSWGLGYSTVFKNQETSHVSNIFAEFSAFPIPPATLRMDYLYDLSRNKHYIRPSIGLSLGVVDILYNYSIPLQKGTNHFKHGVTIRLKYYFNNKNWENSYPSRC